jgi:hypothetical protein
MIQRDTAAALLEPLAQPTQQAFDDALKLAKDSRNATSAWRASCTPQVLTMLVGVEFWAFFASNLAASYRQIEAVTQVEDVHKLQHVWSISDEIRLQLKSDTASVDVEQLMIPGMEAQVGRVQPDVVVLTWSHRGEERFSPAFVHMTRSGDALRQAWRLPVAALLVEKPESIPTDRARRATLVSRLKSAEVANRETGADGHR